MATPVHIKSDLKDVFALASQFHDGSLGDREAVLYARAMVDELNEQELKSAISKLLEVIRHSGRERGCLPWRGATQCLGSNVSCSACHRS